MKAHQIIARAEAALAISEAAMAEAGEATSRNGVSDRETLQRLHREWLNDMVGMVGRPAYHGAIRDPGKAFVDWLKQRLAHPYHVSYRGVDAMCAEYGREVAFLFSEVRWTQEVAWARRMRGADNDRIVFLAELWLAAVRRDPAKLFKKLVGLYVAEVVTDPAYGEAAAHMLSEDEILDGGVGEAYWNPIWLRLAEAEFGRQVNGLPRNRLVALSQRSRDAELAERAMRAKEKQVARLRAWRPALMVSVLTEAVGLGLSSDDVVNAENGFIADVESGALNLAHEASPAWRVFMRTLSRWAESSEGPDEAESSRRVSAIEALPPSWTDRLPEDFRRLGASRHERLLSWFDEIVLQRTRTPPADAAVDFGMWLVTGAAH